MKTKAAVLLAVAVAATAQLSATNYYVDAENGNDAWNGSSATRGEGDVGPKQSLAEVMAISGIKSGDIVYVPKDNLSEYNVFVRKLLPTAQLVNLLTSRVSAFSPN